MLNAHARWSKASTIADLMFLSRDGGMTLAEVLIAIAIFALVFGSVLTGLTQARYRANWSSLNLQAAKFAEQRYEQIQSARWEPTASPAVDEVVSKNFPTTTANLMDYAAGGSLIATNTVRIDTLPTTANPQYKAITCTVVWQYRGRGPFTNIIASVRAPDQ